MNKRTYAVQVFVNRRYVTVTNVTRDISAAYDKFKAFNRVAASAFLGVPADDAPTRLIRIDGPFKATNITVLRKDRTAALKVAA